VYHLPARIALHGVTGIILLPWKDILYCTAESNYTRVHATQDRHYIVSRTLKEVETRLPGSSFFRIHQSHLVQLEAITSIVQHEVYMADQIVLPLARGKRKKLMDILNHTTIHI
jgi:two-component system LytT family response regulator